MGSMKSLNSSMQTAVIAVLKIGAFIYSPYTNFFQRCEIFTDY